MTIKLQYLKGSKEKNAWLDEPYRRMWNVLSTVPGYDSVPTFSLPTLIAKGLVPNVNQEAR